MPDSNGETRRTRNERFGEPSPEVRVPERGAHIWDWFWQLSARRKRGPEALTFADVGDWSRLLLVDPLPQEVEMLMTTDDTYLKAVREDQEAAQHRTIEEARNRK